VEGGIGSSSTARSLPFGEGAFVDVEGDEGFGIRETADGSTAGVVVSVEERTGVVADGKGTEGGGAEVEGAAVELETEVSEGSIGILCERRSLRSPLPSSSESESSVSGTMC
jgi:hypothetical protein